MLQPLSIPDAYFWSQWQAEHSLLANSYFFSTDGGNAVVDPLPFDESARAQIEKLGGISTILVTTPDHEREAQAFSQRYGATIIMRPGHEEEVFPGAIAIRLQDQKSEHEFAVSIPAHHTVVVGDSILGTPAGGLSMLSDRKYADVRKATLGLRRILRENPHTLLVGHGQSIFGGAYDAVYRLLYARAGAEVHRINVDELEFHDERDEHDAQPAQFQCLDAEVGFTIGARKLGYRVSTLQPGHRFCPLHNHAREEELFFVLDGEPSVRTLSGNLRCRKGDFVALPVGESGTHQLLNESEAPATVLLLARTEEVEACYYPDSDKLLVDAEVALITGRRSMMVRGSPNLDYFDGE
ncbi:MAG: cupin domain-containing protein [Candidatus Eremiobacteraeota bacterium]|nr:cupin domain-containing protein [Candidatus Eremiobacteraeota bacterium]